MGKEIQNQSQTNALSHYQKCTDSVTFAKNRGDCANLHDQYSVNRQKQASSVGICTHRDARTSFNNPYKDKYTTHILGSFKEMAIAHIGHFQLEKVIEQDKEIEEVRLDYRRTVDSLRLLIFQEVEKF